MFDKITFRLLKTLYRMEKLTEDEVNAITYTPAPGCGNRHLSFLLENHLIDCKNEGGKIDKEGGFIDGVTVYRINLRGRAYIEQRRRDLLNFWIPYVITTIVAVAGLLVAVAGFFQDAPPVENQGSLLPSHSQVQTDIPETSDK